MLVRDAFDPRLAGSAGAIRAEQRTGTAFCVSAAGLFVSAAISAVAVATGAEISKLYEKPKLWNNIVPSILASACSMGWLYLIVQVQSIPTTLINLYNMVSKFVNL